ncbi:MAG: YidC/Oxa1 family insertase periplasmic-domain containing protein [Phycisphaerae bacterium]|nr:YidC/Oxa1 family insertase periplasmic-domain containing protein [Phycisphaerae bacterium]
MDRRSFIQAMLWATAAFFLFILVSQRYLVPRTRPGTPAEAVPAGQASGESADAAPTSRPNIPGVTSSPATTQALRAVSAEDIGPVALGAPPDDPKSPYRMRLELSPRGAAIRTATLTDYAAKYASDKRYELLQPEKGSEGPEHVSLALETITVNLQTIPLEDAVWQVSRSDSEEEQAVRFTLDVVDGEDRPLLRMIREYALQPQSVESGRHDLAVNLSLENLTNETLDIRLAQRGPVGIRQEYSRADDRYVYTAVSPSSEADLPKLNGVAFRKIASNEKALTEYKRDSGDHFWWHGAGNKYFTFLTVPLDGADGERPDCVVQADALDLNRKNESHTGVTTRLVLRASVPPGGTWESAQTCYVGPNDKESFLRESNADYARRGFAEILGVQYGSCAFGWLTNLMVWLLDGLHKAVPNYGVAIIVLVIIVRALLHPLTRKGQINMVRMQERMGKLQPKIEQIKKLHSNDKVRLQQETMRVYKEEGINPASSMFNSCLPMVIQMPIWIALYTSLANNIQMRHQPFVLWIHDLTAPDALIPFSQSYHVPLLSSLTGPIEAFNLLPILMGITMYLQQKLMPRPQTPASPRSTGSSPQFDQAAQMQKMMPVMSVFFSLILYAMPSGLNLYIMTSSLFGMLEQYYIRKHIRKVKEQDKGAGGAGIDRNRPPRPPRPPSWLARKFQQLQKRAEEAQRVQGRRKQ